MTLSAKSYTYEPGGKPASQTNALGGVTRLTYTSTGLPLTQANPDGTTQSWLYLVDGRLSKETYANGSSRTVTYDDANRSVTSTLRDSANNVLSTEAQNFDRRGNVIQKTDAEGYVSTTTYDALNRSKVVTGPPAVSNSGAQKVTQVYDVAGLWQLDINALGEQTLATFDAEGRPLTVELKNPNGGASVRSTAYQYSADHHSVTTVQGTTGMQSTTFTDLQGKPVLTRNSAGGTAMSRYDVAGNLTSSTDELNRTTSYAYDALNRMVQQALPDGATTKFVYDAAGNLLQRQMPAGLTWIATYDSASRKLTEKLVQGATTTRTWSYTYNTTGFGAGKLAKSTDPKGIVSTLTYDAFGRQTQVASVDATAAASGLTRVFAYDKRSLLKQLDQTYQNAALSPATSVRRTYDGYGALVTEQVYVGGTLKDSWLESHDSAGRRIQLTEVNNPATPFTYKYQADGRLVETVFNNAFYDYSYTNDGQLNWRGTPLHTQNIVRDVMGRIANASQSVYGTTLLSEVITWRGDSTQSTNAISRNGALYENRSYAYDVRGHVLQESFTPQAGYTGTAGYKFDNATTGGLGLRTNVTLGNAVSGSNTQTYSGVAQLNQVSTTGSLVGGLGTPVAQSFDATGQVTVRKGSTATDTLTWDALGRLVGVSRRNSANGGLNWSAVYDGLNRRLQTSQQTVTNGALVGTAMTLKSSYDPEVEFLELAVMSPTARYWKVHGPDLNGRYSGLQGTGGLEAVYNAASGVTTSILNDTYGTAALTVTAANGTASYTFNPVTGSGYGTAPGGLAAVPMDGGRDLASVIAWRGHYVDGTGYYYMGMRYYAPESGTFLSADPLGHAACMDLYSYCNGDPVNGLDPDGRFGKGAASAVGDRLSGIWGAVSHPLDTVTGIGSGLMDAADTLWGGRSDVLGMLGGGLSGLGDGFQKLGTQFSSAKGIGEFYGGATFDFALGAGLAKGVGLAGEAASSLRAGLSAGAGGIEVVAPVRWGPATGVGPLGEGVAKTFRSASYTELVTQETTTLYRVYGGKAGELGSYWTRTAPTGPLQSQLDSALLTEWQNSASNVVKIQVPKGTTVFEGAAAPQTGSVKTFESLIGGGNQVYVPKVDPRWIVK